MSQDLDFNNKTEDELVELIENNQENLGKFVAYAMRKAGKVLRTWDHIESQETADLLSKALIHQSLMKISNRRTGNKEA